LDLRGTFTLVLSQGERGPEGGLVVCGLRSDSLSLWERARVRARPLDSQKTPLILTSRARRLRRDSTDAERALWSVLRNRQLGGYKFRRQTPIGGHIVDFVCMERRLVVEVDGGQHQERWRKDRQRTALLESKGFRVLRFWNNEVLTGLESVADAILMELERDPLG